MLGHTTYSIDILQLQDDSSFFKKTFITASNKELFHTDESSNKKITSCHFKCLKRKSTIHCAHTKSPFFMLILQHVRENIQKMTNHRRAPQNKIPGQAFPNKSFSKTSLQKRFYQKTTYLKRHKLCA